VFPELPLPGTDATIRTSIVTLLVAVATETWLAYRWLRSDGVETRRARAALAVFWVAALLAGRVHHLAATWGRLPDHGWRVLLQPSFHAPGVVVGGLLAITLLVPRLGVPMRPFGDAVAGPAGIAFAIARLGCFLNGCCYGVYCPYPWGVVFPIDHPLYLIQVDQGRIPLGATRLAAVHPLQLYFAASGLAIAAFLYWWRPRKRFDGEIGLFFLVLFTVSGALLEPLRETDPGRVFLGRWPQLLVVMASLAVVSTLLLVGFEWWERRQRLDAEH
jgi:phosphatidylglycerol:prolipoprotein diacylglycerol transferase